MFEDHTALVQSRRRRSARTRLARDQGPRRRHAAHRGPLERGRAAAAAPRRSRTFDAADPAAYAGRPERLSRASSRTTTWCAGRPRMGFRILDDDHRRRAALGDGGRPRARASRPPTTSVSATEYAQFAAAVAQALLGQLRRPAGGATTSRSGTSPTTVTSSSRHSDAPRIYRKLVERGVPAIRANGAPRREGLRRRAGAGRPRAAR